MFLDGSLNLLVPLEWLNDLIDEFLYQWQDFHAFRHQLGKDPAEVEILRKNPNVWRTSTVLNYLQSFYERVESFRAFALVGLCRANCILADYREAIRVLLVYLYI